MATKSRFVYLDVSIERQKLGRICIELFSDRNSKISAINFWSLCTVTERSTRRVPPSFKGVPLSYKGATFYRSEKGSYIEGGDIVAGNGIAGMSCFKNPFSHDPVIGCDIIKAFPYCLQMADNGDKKSDSRFIITTKNSTYHAKNKPVFGRVVKGTEVVDQIEGYNMYRVVTIIDCGTYDPAKESVTWKWTPWYTVKSIPSQISAPYSSQKGFATRRKDEFATDQERNQYIKQIKILWKAQEEELFPEVTQIDRNRRVEQRVKDEIRRLDHLTALKEAKVLEEQAQRAEHDLADSIVISKDEDEEVDLVACSETYSSIIEKVAEATIKYEIVEIINVDFDTKFNYLSRYANEETYDWRTIEDFRESSSMDLLRKYHEKHFDELVRLYKTGMMENAKICGANIHLD